MNIAIAGTGYVGLSLAVLLAQHNKVTAVDVIPEKVDMINNRKSPIQDDYIEEYLAEKELNLTAILDGASAIYHTVIATCRMKGISVLNYFKEFFLRIVRGETDYTRLMPDTISLQS